VNDAHRREPAVWLAGAIGFAVTLAAFWPGYLSFDAAYQWWQARHGQYSSVHPPLLSIAWSFTERLHSGPGPVFAMFALMHWFAFTWIASRLVAPSPLRIGVLWLAGFWPPLFALLAHVWKDVAVMTLFGLGVALLASGSRRRIAFALAASCFVLGAAMRHNAITALPPLLLWMAWVATPADTRRPRLRALGIAFGASLVVFGLARLPEHVPGVERIPAWPAVAAWDLAAVSVQEQRVLLPREILFVPDDPLPLLGQHYAPASNVPTLVSGGVRSNFLFPYSEAVSRDLRARWLALPFEYPGSYFEHRLAVSARLFGLVEDPLAAQQVLMPGIVAYQDNPPLAPRADALNRSVQGALQSLVPSLLFDGWLYLLVAGGLVVVATRRRGARNQLAAATALSGLCYALPLVIATGSAEFRYLSWLVAATLLAALLCLPARSAPAEPLAPSIDPERHP
jgi:hypothetical protein